MKNLMLLLVLAAFTVSGCATIDYFKRSENQKVLLDAGVTCFQGQDYTLGIAYGFSRDGQKITNDTSVEAVIGCDDRKFSVICDVTKGPEEDPCSDVRSYTEDPPPNAEPVPEPTPEPVPAVETPAEPVVETPPVV